MRRRSRNQRSGNNKNKRQRWPSDFVPVAGGDESVSTQVTTHSGVKCEGRPYEIKISNVLGRYLVATRDFRPAENILDEEAIVVGPCQGSKPVCLVCYRPLIPKDKSLAPIPVVLPCDACRWPLCAAESCIHARSLPGVVHDHSAECKVFAASKEQKDGAASDPMKAHGLYEAIVPLRCLLYRESNPRRWEVIAEMESHDSIRKMRPSIWNNNQEKVVDVIRGTWGLGEMFSEDEVHTVCGALEVNAFEVGRNGSSLRALFGPHAYLIAHDCVPNTSHVDVFEHFSEGKTFAGVENKEIGIFRMKIRSTTEILRGESIFISYAYTLQGTMARREHLRLSKFFSCNCRRCGDPTELGTFLSALRCTAACGGHVLPTDSLAENPDWRCDTCGGRQAGHHSSVHHLLARLTQESESLSSVEAFEDFIKRHCNTLHPSHYLMIGVKHSLSQLYGKVSGYTIHEMPKSLLERKRDICRELLAVFDVVEPGKSRLRGITLYELHAPLMTLITRDLQDGKLNTKSQKRQLLKRLKEVINCLEEAKDILQYEPANSPDAVIAAAASDGLKGLQNWLSSVA